MDILLGSNIVGRFADVTSSVHAETVSALEALSLNNHRLVIVPQNVYEFTSFGSRPLVNGGLGLSPEGISLNINKILAFAECRFPNPQDELRLFQGMHSQLGIIGKQVHDLRLVAACRALGISHLLTYNDADFSRAVSAGHIQTMTPPEVLLTYPPTP